MRSYSNSLFRSLNKITPDSFYSSAKSILNINVVSSDILDIFVTLIFQKASNEPNFTYLYSQLCVILCEKAHNFEIDNIYSRCETEFFKRHNIDFNNPAQRQRSIGAIRFIAYLGVDNAIPHRILHDCVRTLLLCKSTTITNQTPPISAPQDSSSYPKENEEIALDMECLCEFMKIAGSHLDTPKARNLMNQYFGRMVQIVERASPDRLCEIRNGAKGVKFVPLSTRIRFMITDVVDLRKNNWKPLFEGQLNDCGYPWHAEDLIREYEESLLTYPRSSSAIHVGGSGGDALDQRSLESGTASSSISSDWTTLNQMGKALCSRRGNKDIDLFASSSNSNDGGASSLYSASNLTPRDSNNGGNCGASVWGRRNAGGGIQEKRGSTPLFRARKSPTPVSKVVRSSNSAAFFEPDYLHSSVFPTLQKSQDHVRGSGGATSSCASSAAVTPATASPDIDAMITGRADVRQLSSSSLGGGSGGGLPHNHGAGIWRPSRLYSMYGPPHQPAQPPGIITYAERPVHVDENKEAAKSVIAILSRTKNIQEAIDQLADKELLSKLSKEVILKCMLLLCDVSMKPTSTGLDHNSKRAACQFTSLLLYESKHRESFTPALENSWPLVLQRLSAASSKTAPAFLAARLILTGQLSLAKVAEPLTAGRHHPLYLLTLQQLGKVADSGAAPGAFLLIEENGRGGEKADDGEFIPEGVDFLEGSQEERRKKLMEFVGSWVVLEEMLPEGSQSPTQILEILEERGIDFLVPHLRLVVRTLCPLLTFGSDLRTFADHLPTLKDHLSTELVHAIIGAAYERVWLTSSKIDISKVSEEELEDIEEAVWREMLEEGKLGKCVSYERQLDVLHALQVFWNDKGRPKGFMLRCFQNLYHFSLVDKPIFFEWQKEENQTYPVKGKALFEVMRWLKWLETVTESEDSDGSDAASEETDSPQGNHIASCDLKMSGTEAVTEKNKSFTLPLNHFVNDGGDNFNETTKMTSENSE
nr:eukaryotic translation initiation factor 4 gamma [Hymenolepis microstoma]